jgi:hypothetical protein
MLPVELRDNLAMRLFGKKYSDAVRLNICIKCEQPMNLHMLSTEDRHEYLMSALCPKCYAEIMGEEE